jgi:hypothetical protein
VIGRKARVIWSAYPARGDGWALCRSSRGTNEFCGQDRWWCRKPENVGQPFTLEQAQGIADAENAEEQE